MILLVTTLNGSQHRIPLVPGETAEEAVVQVGDGIWFEAEDGTWVYTPHIVSMKPLKEER